MLSEISQTKTNNTLSHLYVESKIVELIKLKVELWFPGGREQGKWGDVGQRVQTITSKMNRFGGCNIQYDDYS